MNTAKAIQPQPKEIIYVYNEEHAIAVMNEEIEKGTNFELNCVKQQQRVCSSDNDIKKFYEDKVTQ